MDNIRLTDLIDKNILQKLQESFAIATGINSSIKDLNGNKITEPTNRQDFCKLIRENPEYSKGCEYSDGLLIECLKVKKKFIKPCHLNITDFAAPIMIGNEVNACILGGQVFPSEYARKKAIKIINNLEGLSKQKRNELLKLLNSIPAKSRKDIKNISTLMQEVANTISQLAYEKWQSKQKAVTKTEHYELLHKVSNRLLSFDNLDEIMDYTVNITREYLQSETSSIFLFDSGKMKRKRISGIENEWFEDESYKIGEGITGRVAKPRRGEHFGKSILINNARNSKYILQRNKKLYESKLKTGKLMHLISVPLNGEHRTFGVLRVINRIDEKGKLAYEGFSYDDMDLLYTIASQVSVAIANIRRRDKMRTVFKLNDLMAEKYTERQIRKEIVDLLTGNIWKFRMCFLQIYDEKSGMLLVKAGSGEFKKYKGEKYIRIKKGDGIAGRVLKCGKNIPVKNVQKDKRFKLNEWAKANNLFSMLCVPLKSKNRIIGTLSIFTDFEYTFYPDEISFLESFASKAAFVIENNRLNNKNEKMIDELIAVDFVARELSRELELKSLFKLILEKATDLLNADIACIKLLDESTNELVLKYAVNCPIFDKFGEYRLHISKGVTGRVARTGKAEVIDNLKLDTDSWTHNNDPAFKDIKSEIVIPIKLREKVIGILSLESYTTFAFTEDDKRLFQAFSNHAAIAVRNANFINKLQRITETYPKISELNINIDNVLKKIIDIAAEVLETDIIVLYRYDEKNKKIIWPPIWNGDIKYPQYMGTQVDASAAPLLFIKRGESYFSENSQEDQIMVDTRQVPRKGIPERFPIRENIISSAGILLKVGKEIVGIMFINYRKPYTFDNDEQRIIENYASYIAIAIQNVLHFRDKEISDTMTTLGKITSRIAHKIKNDISTIGLYTEDLIDDTKIQSTQYEPLKRIEKKVKKISNDINYLLQASRSQVKIKKLINIYEYFKELEFEIMHDIKIHNINFIKKISDDIPKIKLDPLQIKIVILNLFYNSIDAMPNGGKIIFSITRQRNNILLEWKDTGFGISPKDYSKIFEFCWTTKVNGFGLGLFHAQKIIEEHSGSISVDSNYKNGARFIIKLPIN